MNPQKLAQLQSQVRIGGKGTPRRKTKKPAKVHADSSKVTAALKKLNVQPVGGIEEVNMFRLDGKVLHFKHPKGSAVFI
jgi:nascent polypeptide-associated complex subunit beta